ncbi:MAG: hypothetical protein KF819_05500 [Labilithrix sp.]|nr:hypothetical protein [Labilithrix sp.]
MTRLLWSLVGLVASVLLVACMESKVAQGQRFVSGDQKYDPYFENVHQQQVAASTWPDDKKSVRRPLVNALALTPDASDDTIISATRERAKKLGGGGAKLELTGPHVTAQGGATNDGALFGAVEESVRAEQERARKLRGLMEKLDEMAKQGGELKKDADKAFENRGANKADEKKTESMRQLRHELGAAVDAMKSLARDATKSIKEGDEFLDDLGSALQMKETPKRGRGGGGFKTPAPPGTKPATEEPKKPAPPAEEPKKPAPKAEPPKEPPRPKPKPAGEKPAEKPPAEKPAEKPPAPKPAPEEVFNP